VANEDVDEMDAWPFSMDHAMIRTLDRISCQLYVIRGMPSNPITSTNVSHTPLLLRLFFNDF
jgi:hypothetical protein